MIAVISIAIYIAALIMLKRTTGTYIFAALFFLLFGFTLRMASALYVGMFGPVFATNLSRYIGDVGGASLVFSASIVVFLVAASLTLRPRSILARAYPAARFQADRIAGLAFMGMATFVAVMYGDMLLRGTIPLFSFMERNVYTNEYAGIFHKAFFEFSFLFAFIMGFFLVRPRLQGKSYELRYLFILLALFAYFILTGHRFSIFFSFTAFFIIPLSALQVLSQTGRLRPSDDPEQLKKVVGFAKAFAPLIIIVLIGAIAFALYNSIYNVRGYADPVQAFIQRSLVQPTELWWATWDHSILRGGRDGAQAFDLMFVNPVDGQRNTGIQFLMVKELGYERAAELLAYGEQFAGGYPEVFFELLGPFWAWPALIGFAFLTLNFLRIAMTAVINQRLGTAIFAIYLFYGFSILYIGGMLNFLLAFTLYVKIILLIAFMNYERPPTRLQAYPRIQRTS
jgi:hypothetical protein